MSQELIDYLRVDWIVDPGQHLDVAGIETLLPAVGGRDDGVGTDELAPVHVISEGRGEQPEPVASLAVDLVRLLENGHSSPFEVAGVHQNALLLHQDLEPVIETPDHDGADRPHR